MWKIAGIPQGCVSPHRATGILQPKEFVFRELHGAIGGFNAAGAPAPTIYESNR